MPYPVQKIHRYHQICGVLFATQFYKKINFCEVDEMTSLDRGPKHHFIHSISHTFHHACFFNKRHYFCMSCRRIRQSIWTITQNIIHSFIFSFSHSFHHACFFNKCHYFCMSCRRIRQPVWTITQNIIHSFIHSFHHSCILY